MTELGIYILGATALAILTAAGLSRGDATVILCVVLASGAAYLSQLFAALSSQGQQWAVAPNGVFMLAAFGSWLYGVWSLL